MKTIRVVAAVIHDNNRIFATARGYGEFKGGWEFPGGKIEEDETSEQALVREIKEELNIDIQLNEAAEARWLSYETIDDVDWLPADKGLVDKIKERLRS